jgi:hypothetical protein
LALTTSAFAGVPLKIPDANGVIHGCYSTKTGSLRVTASTCAKGEKALTWNQKGPKGSNGGQGPKGDQGSIGPPGPSNAFARFRDASTPISTGPISGTALPASNTVLHLNLGPGSYAITGKLYIANAAPFQTSVVCQLNVTSGEYDNSNDSVAASTSRTMPLQVAATLSAAGGVDLRCATSAPTSQQFAYFMKITAIQVGALSSTPG